MSIITVQWDAAIDNIGVKGYDLEVDGVIINVGNVLVYYDHVAVPNTLRTYRVRSYDFSNNKSPWSDYVTETSCNDDILPPTIPTNLFAHSVSGTEIDLTWDASTDDVGVAGYILLIGGYAINVGNVTSYSDTGLTPGNTYSYFVRAYDTVGHKSGWSNEAIGNTGADVVESGVQVVESAVNVIET